MADLVPGVIADVAVLVTAVDTGAGTATVRVVDNNNQPITAATTLPAGIVRPVAMVVAVNDVLESLADQTRAVVAWIDPLDARRWAPSPSGAHPQSSMGWRKIGMFVP
jgi:hypothetical protein